VRSSDLRIGPWARDERGATLVMFAVFLPVLVLMLSFVLDVGNWFAHKRHLQMQADASALAAALDLRAPCSDGAVDDTAASYSGRDYNAQVQSRQASVHMLINSPTYYQQTSPVDTTVDTDPPCTSMQVDVKLTETDLPWYFRLASVPFINAHARVSLFTVDKYTGALPLAVPDADPKKLKAQFFDEDTGEVIATTPLTKAGQVGQFVNWDNANAPVSVTVDRRNIGVRVIVSGSSSTTCGDPLVECFGGVDYVRGWTAATSAPEARSVTLTPGTCGDPYFNYLTTTCNVGVSAKLDFGSGVDPTKVKVTITGKNGQPVGLTYSAGTGTWASGTDNSTYVQVAPGAGPVPVSLDWEVTSGTIGSAACNTTNRNPCKGTFSNVQRSYSGSDATSGPIRLVDVSENKVPDTNSIERCSTVKAACTHDLVVTVGLVPTLSVASSISDPVVKLRFSGGGSQSQGLDCDSNNPNFGNPNAPDAIPNFSLFEVELQWGCRPAYAPNTGTACPGSVQTLWSTPNPVDPATPNAASWQCVANQTGQYVNKIGKGLNARILCPKLDWGLAACSDPYKPTACTHPNNWSQFDTGLPANDPRIVQLFVTQYGIFSGTGGYTVPVTRFATFYVTGWNGSGGGFSNPCQGNGDDTAADGEIVGHFIKYIDSLASTTETTLCNLSDATPCVPVMTQ
jgi:hypothetical protein